MRLTIAIVMLLGLILIMLFNPILIKRWYVVFPIVALLYGKVLITVLSGDDIAWAIGAYGLGIVLLFGVAKVSPVRKT
jgi:hypothetical protein